MGLFRSFDSNVSFDLSTAAMISSEECEEWEDDEERWVLRRTAGMGFKVGRRRQRRMIRWRQKREEGEGDTCDVHQRMIAERRLNWG
ncbi:hypothetical protein HPP92_010490 [Vanilla planifolia]|uniref:Uncharacterized protein n=1 Tax=Vanilla planifolia TaxID=51239 RepID=A0A835UZC0_VANPL|nr:hypothetical protein HPP92_010490 [Vanilla planifolia]